MRRQLSLLLCGVMTAGLLAGCGSSAAQQNGTSVEKAADTENDAPADKDESAAADTVVWKFCNGVSDTHPQSSTMAEFADAFTKATNGRVTFELYNNNSLGSEEELTEMCRSNTLQCFYGNITTGLPNYMEEFGVFALPYLFHSWDDAYDYLMNADKAKELWARLEEATNLHYIAVTLNGERALSTKGVKQITKPEELKGVKVRSMTAQVWQDVVSALGATPVPISYSELYVSLQTGVVEGQDNGIANVYDSKLYEVQDIFYKTGHGYTMSGFFVSADAWKELSEKEQQTFTELFTEICVEKYNKDMEGYYAEGFQAAEAAGMKIVEQTELDMDAFYDSANLMIDEKYMDNEKYSDIITDVRAYFNY